MANFKSSDRMNYHQPVQKRDPELGSYEAIDSSNCRQGPGMYVETYPSMYVQPSPIIPGVERHNVKMEITAVSEGSDVCRVCTVTAARTEGERYNSNMLLIFENTAFADRVAWVLELPMFEGDGLPHHLCSDCRARVDSAFDFKTLAWHSDKLLRQAANASQQAKESNTYLEDIARVDLPGPEEDDDRPLEEIAQVNVQEEGGLRILSCTSLSHAEEQLLLSGGLKGPGTKRGRLRKVPAKANGVPKRGKRLKVLAAPEDFLLPESCLMDILSIGGDGSKQKTKVAERKQGEMEVAAAAGKKAEAKITAQKGKECDFAVVALDRKEGTTKMRFSHRKKRCEGVAMALSGKEAEAKITAKKGKERDFAIVALGEKEGEAKICTSHRKKICKEAVGSEDEKGGTKITAQKMKEGDLLLAPGRKESTLKMTTHEEEKCDVVITTLKECEPKITASTPGEKGSDFMDSTDVTEFNSIENRRDAVETSPQSTQNVPSSAREGNVDQLAVKADKSSVETTDEKKGGRNGRLQGSSGQETDRDSCNMGPNIEEAATVGTHSNHKKQVSTSCPRGYKMEKGKAATVSSECDHSSKASSKRPQKEETATVTTERDHSSDESFKGPQKEETSTLETESEHPSEVSSEMPKKEETSTVRTESDHPSEVMSQVPQKEETSTLKPESKHPSEACMEGSCTDIRKEKVEVSAVSTESETRNDGPTGKGEADCSNMKATPTSVAGGPSVAPRRKRGRPPKAVVEEDSSADDDNSAAIEVSAGEVTVEKKLFAPINKKMWSCPDCEREFGKKKDFTAHLTNHGARQPMKCAFCQAVYCSLGRYNSHVRAHKGKGPPPKPEAKVWACDDCQKEFTFKKDLRAHLTNHGTRRAMQCSFCQTVFCSLGRYNTHVRAHKGRKTFDCGMCSLRFYRPVDLTNHCRVHSAGRAHLCEVCGLALPSTAGLEAHTKTQHTKEKLFKCKVCDKPFTFLGSMKDHLRLKHPEHYVVQCDSCQKTFETAEELQEHIATHVGVSCYTCNKCNKKFSIKEAYKSHVRNHDRARPYICETCGKSFLNKSALKCHQRTHTGDRPYKCHMCDKTYGHPSALRTHLMSHTDERCYSCSICGKSFRGKETLKRHMVAHSNLREFKCTVCGLEFLHKGNLNRHLNNMHGRLVGTKDTRADDSSGKLKKRRGF